jgi:transcription initiation factor TFIID subunit 6
MQLTNGTSAIPFDSEFVKTISESVVGGAVSEQTADAVLTHLNCILRLILIASKDNRVACGRTEISVEDIRIAMKDLGLGTCLCFELEHRANFRATMSLPHEIKSVPKSIDELVPEIISKRVMADVTIKSHWLSIDGIQPAIPENPVTIVDDEPMEVTAAEKSTIKRKPGPLLIKEAARKMPKTEQVQIKSTTTHTLSVEQQIFFKEIMETIMGSDETKRTEAIHCLRTDPGLQPLIPRFSNAIAEGVRCNLIQETVAFLIYLMRIIEAFVQNNTINIEKCLHELIPPIISCLVVRSPGIDVGPRSASWTLREFCAKLLHKIVQRYKIPQLKERLVRVFSNAFTRRDPYIPTLYGVIFAINLFGPEVIENILFPNLSAVKNAINSYRPINERRFNQEKTQQEKANGLSHEQQKLTDLVMKIATTYANSDRMTDKGLDSYRDLFGPFAQDVYDRTSSDADRQQYYSGRNF